MTLYITHDAVDPMCGTRMEPEMLAVKSSHLVLASVEWDEVWIDVAEAIEEGTLVYLHTRSKRIYARVPDHPSRHQMVLLCELYPEKAGSIRKAFLKGANINELLPYVWREGCAPGRGSLPVLNAK